MKNAVTIWVVPNIDVSSDKVKEYVNKYYDFAVKAILQSFAYKVNVARKIKNKYGKAYISMFNRDYVEKFPIKGMIQLKALYDIGFDPFQLIKYDGLKKKIFNIDRDLYHHLREKSFGVPLTQIISLSVMLGLYSENKITSEDILKLSSIKHTIKRAKKGSENKGGENEVRSDN